MCVGWCVTYVLRHKASHTNWKRKQNSRKHEILNNICVHISHFFSLLLFHLSRSSYARACFLAFGAFSVWHFFPCVLWVCVFCWWVRTKHSFMMTSTRTFSFEFELCFSCCVNIDGDVVINSKVQAHWRHKICMNVYFMWLWITTALVFQCSLAHTHSHTRRATERKKVREHDFSLASAGLHHPHQPRQCWNVAAMTHDTHKIYPYLNESIQEILWHSCIKAACKLLFHIRVNNNTNSSGNNSNMKLRCVDVIRMLRHKSFRYEMKITHESEQEHIREEAKKMK